MNKRFIYFSHTGNGDYLAEYLSKRGYEITKVNEKSKLPKSFFFSMMVGGFRSGLGLKGKLIDYHPDLSPEEEVIIGSPIWNGRLVPAINAVLAQTDLSNRKLTFLLYCGGGEAPKAVAKLSSRYPDAFILVLKEPKKHPEELSRLEDMIR